MEPTTQQQHWMQVQEIELVYRSSVKISERPFVTSSDEAYQILRHLWNPDILELQEEFKVLLLNRANRILGIYTASRGGITGTVVDIRLLLVAALKAGACSIMLAHNHPSGNLKPSNADIQLTRKIALAADLMDLKVLDHLIISTEGYYSFGDEGEL